MFFFAKFFIKLFSSDFFLFSMQKSFTELLFLFWMQKNLSEFFVLNVKVFSSIFFHLSIFLLEKFFRKKIIRK